MECCLCLWESGFKMTAKVPTGFTCGVFILHRYLSFCYAECCLNNMHYPRHQLQGSIIPVLLVRAWLTTVRWCVISCPRCRVEAQFSQLNRLICSGEKDGVWSRWNGTMKMRESVGSVCVLMGHLISVFPISALMICLRLFPWRSALLLMPRR